MFLKVSNCFNHYWIFSSKRFYITLCIFFPELMHVLGFLHMHTTHDRDKFVSIFWMTEKVFVTSHFCWTFLNSSIIVDWNWVGQHNASCVSHIKALSIFKEFNVFASNSSVNFMSYESDVSMFGTKYDFESITHYPTTAFSENGEQTIKSKEPGGDIIMVKTLEISFWSFIKTKFGIGSEKTSQFRWQNKVKEF